MGGQPHCSSDQGPRRTILYEQLLSVYHGVIVQIYLSSLNYVEERYIVGNLGGQVPASESRCSLRGEREEINEQRPGPSKEYTNTQIYKYTKEYTNIKRNTKI